MSGNLSPWPRISMCSRPVVSSVRESGRRLRTIRGSGRPIWGSEVLGGAIWWRCLDGRIWLDNRQEAALLWPHPGLTRGRPCLSATVHKMVRLVMVGSCVRHAIQFEKRERRTDMLNPSRRMPMIMLALTLGVGLLCLAAPGEAQKTEITVGAALSTTGRFSTEAGDALKAYQLFIEETNAAGGVSVRSLGKRLPLRLVSYDDQSDASTAAKLYERLITTDKVDLLFSPWGSGHNRSEER